MCEDKGSTTLDSHWEDWSVGEHVLLAYQPNNVIHQVSALDLTFLSIGTSRDKCQAKGEVR